MTTDEMIDLLTLAAGYDRRTVGEADVTAWQLAVGDLPFGDAKLAVVAHYRETTDWLMPAHVRTRVREVRAARLQESPLTGRPPADPAEYAAWLGAERRRIADGVPAPKAIGGAR